MSLEQHLSDCYCERHHVAGYGGAHDRLAEALRSDQDMAGLARMELLRLQALDRQCHGQLWRRCSISHHHRLALEGALNGI